jgi:transcriptional regulator with XRE-family HTH domain
VDEVALHEGFMEILFNCAASAGLYPSSCQFGKSTHLHGIIILVYSSCRTKVEHRVLRSQMPHERLRNYIKSHRKRAGLSQPDVAFLLGSNDETQVSRYENEHRLPSLEVALALQEIFKTPLPELFAGLHESIAADVVARIHEFSSRIQKENAGDRVTLRKLQWLQGSRAHIHTISCTH